MKIIKDIYQYREFLKSNVKKEVRGKYKKSFLGFIWSFLNPLLQLLVYSIIFPLILRNTQDNYVIFLCVALIPWNFFSMAITATTGSIIYNNNIIKKVYFPRIILPISVVTSATYNFIISTIIILGFLLFSGLGITWHILFYPLILLLQYILLLGISFILSSITVYLRDIEHFTGIILMILFYLTPIVYSSDSIPARYLPVFYLNPMAHIINSYRDIFYNQTTPDMKSLGLLAIFVIILVFLGYAIFNKLQRNFAEEL